MTTVETLTSSFNAIYNTCVNNGTIANCINPNNPNIQKLLTLLFQDKTYDGARIYQYGNGTKLSTKLLNENNKSLIDLKCYNSTETTCKVFEYNSFNLNNKCYTLTTTFSENSCEEYLKERTCGENLGIQFSDFQDNKQFKQYSICPFPQTQAAATPGSQEGLTSSVESEVGLQGQASATTSQTTTLQNSTLPESDPTPITANSNTWCYTAASLGAISTAFFGYKAYQEWCTLQSLDKIEFTASYNTAKQRAIVYAAAAVASVGVTAFSIYSIDFAA